MGMPDYPYITADELGTARCYNTYARSNPRDINREMHFTVKLRNAESGFTYGPHGWLTRNKTTDRFNCVVKDGIHISHTNFYMTKPEFQTFLDRAKQNAPARP